MIIISLAVLAYLITNNDNNVTSCNNTIKVTLIVSREKDKLHVEWVTAWTGVFSELSDYIKQHHTTGVTWNPRGGSPLGNLRSAPPPPPPGEKSP